jgi:hypothetical protein
MFMDNFRDRKGIAKRQKIRFKKQEAGKNDRGPWTADRERQNDNTRRTKGWGQDQTTELQKLRATELQKNMNSQ